MSKEVRYVSCRPRVVSHRPREVSRGSREGSYGPREVSCGPREVSHGSREITHRLREVTAGLGRSAVDLGSLALPSVTQVTEGSPVRRVSPSVSLPPCHLWPAGDGAPSRPLRLQCGLCSLVAGTARREPPGGARPHGPHPHKHPALSFSSDKVHTAGVRVPGRPGLPQEDGGGNQEAGAVRREVATGGLPWCVLHGFILKDLNIGVRGERET